MPSCLGFSTDKNMIKYAKVNRDKNSGMFFLEAYGIKFFDNIQTTIDDIVAEVGIDQTTLTIALSNEGYHSIEVFSALKNKDRNDLIESEFNVYCDSIGLVPSAVEMRHQLVQNTGNIDKFLAICAYASKSELANLHANFKGYKVTSIAPVALSIANLFRNKGIDEEAVIVNIDNKTTVTILLRNEVQDVIDIPLGMEDVIDKLAEKYNSYAKAYEACKKISVYIEDVTALDEESRDILDVVLPVLYDIRQRVDEALNPYKRLIKAVYISGTVVSVNNVDLYFQENFPSMRCELVKPFFILQKDRGIQKEIIEVNSAIAIALNGLGLLEPTINFNAAAKKVVRDTPIKDAIEKLNISSKISDIKNSAREVKDNIKNAKSTAKNGRNQGFSGITKKITEAFSQVKGKVGKGKVRVAYDGDISNQQEDYGKAKGTSEGIDEITAFDTWLTRLAVGCVGILLIYLTFSAYVTNTLEEKVEVADTTINKVNAEIEKANSDADYIRTRTSEYTEKISKLETVMQEIETEKRKNTFDIPNFMSQVMFIIPQGVSISNINVSEMGDVEILANSTQYAQLGYFVSRLKLEQVLLNVDMTVIEMEQTITIKIRGQLP